MNLPGGVVGDSGLLLGDSSVLSFFVSSLFQRIGGNVSDSSFVMKVTGTERGDK